MSSFNRNIVILNIVTINFLNKIKYLLLTIIYCDYMSLLSNFTALLYCFFIGEIYLIKIQI